MIITCEKCSTRFQLDASRVPATGAKVRCSRCRHAFVVRPRDTAPEALHWHLKVDGEAHNMIDGPETRLDLDPGAHVLTAVLSAGDDHMEDPDAPRSEVSVTVEP